MNIHALYTNPFRLERVFSYPLLEKTMYSPTIHPTLIPILYRLGQHRDQPMTRLTDELILDALERVELPLPCHDLLDTAKRVLRPSEPVLKEAA